MSYERRCGFGLLGLGVFVSLKWNAQEISAIPKRSM